VEAPPLAQAAVMNHVNGASRTLTLELLAVGDGLSGRAIGDDGAAREFNGRIGLMHAIDELLVDPAPREERLLPTQAKRRNE
jgi:hypothetical protein